MAEPLKINIFFKKEKKKKDKKNYATGNDS
jgi:hypothetical protein